MPLAFLKILFIFYDKLVRNCRKNVSIVVAVDHSSIVVDLSTLPLCRCSKILHKNKNFQKAYGLFYCGLIFYDHFASFKHVKLKFDNSLNSIVKHIDLVYMLMLVLGLCLLYVSKFFLEKISIV